MRRTLALLAVAFLLPSCAGLLGEPSDRASEQERSDLAAALARAETDPRATERQLADFLQKWPESPLADDAALRRAELALERGDQAAARHRYALVIERYPDGDRIDSARVALAKIESARGDRDSAAALLGQTRFGQLDADERQAAYRLLANVARDPVARLRWLSRLRAGETDEDAIALIDVEIDETVLRLEDSDLDRAADQLGKAIPAARVLILVAERALDDDDLPRARSAVARAGRYQIAEPYGPRMDAVVERLRLRESGRSVAAELPTFAEVASRRPPITDGATGRIGVVLPLSGDFARFGEASLHGVLLATGIFGGGPEVTVVIRDSAGRPDRAAAAVRELADDEDVVAIIGPLLSGECEAAASEAESIGVPLLALSTREEIAGSRREVFRLRTRPSEETQLLADHAIRELGAQRFAILYPRDAYGRGLRNLFWDAVEERGGRIVGVASYDPDANDFAEPIRRLVGYVLLDDGEKLALKERESMLRRARRLPAEEALALRTEARELTGPDDLPLPPIVDFDALFIPESHEKVVLIAPQLAFHDATGMRLLGTNGWHHPDLVEIGQHHVEGAVFTTDFYGESELPYVKNFADRFESTFGAPPDSWSAVSFDAANLVLVQLARGRDSRDSVRKGVLDVDAYPGVSGVLSMRRDGNAKKRPFLLGVERGHVVGFD